MIRIIEEENSIAVHDDQENCVLKYTIEDRADNVVILSEDAEYFHHIDTIPQHEYVRTMGWTSEPYIEELEKYFKDRSYFGVKVEY